MADTRQCLACGQDSTEWYMSPHGTYCWGCVVRGVAQGEEDDPRCCQCGGELENMARTQACHRCLEDHWQATH